MTLESIWHLNGNSYSTRRIHLSQLFRVKLFKLYSNIVKCVNLIEIRLNAPSFQVYFDIVFETTGQIPEVEFGGKYEHMRANTDICRYLPWGQITNTYFYLLLDMQKRTYCNKICDKYLLCDCNITVWMCCHSVLSIETTFLINNFYMTATLFYGCVVVFCL